MKIIQLTAENIKKLKAVEITPSGAVVQITGANGSGKTSVLDAIYYALAGTKNIPSQPVRNGAQKAIVKLDLGEVTVTRRFTEAGGTSLAVEAADGKRFPSPQKVLDELLGALSFDPLAFSRMEPRAQLEELRKVVPLDVDIDALDAVNARDYAARTELNRQAKALEAQANVIPVAVGLPGAAVDISALLGRMEDSSKQNAEIAQEKSRRERVILDIEQRRKEANELEAKVKMLRQQAESQEQGLAACRPIPESIDTAELRKQIEAARGVNAQIEARERRAAIAKDREKLEAESTALTAAMEKRAAERQQAIASAAMPVRGLSFGAGEVLYNGLPFAQASSAEQLRVSVAIAMRANPKLRVLRITDGSLLDEASLQLIADMAAADDFQIWIERVDTTGKVGIYLEDGEVKS